MAIPSLIAYRYLRGKVERLVISMEKEAMKLVDALDERSDLIARDLADRDLAARNHAARA